MSLIRRRRMHTMNARLDKPTRQRRQGITGVDRDGSILRTHPLPLALRVKNLQSCNGLAEEQSDCSQIGMAGTVQIADSLVLLCTAGCVVHVAEMVFTFDIVLVIADELVFVWEVEEDGEKTEELFNYFSMAFLECHLVWSRFIKYRNKGRTYPAKSLDFTKMLRKNCRLMSLVMPIELGNVVYLHIILDAIPKADPSIINLSSKL